MKKKTLDGIPKIADSSGRILYHSGKIIRHLGLRAFQDLAVSGRIVKTGILVDGGTVWKLNQ